MQYVITPIYAVIVSSIAILCFIDLFFLNILILLIGSVFCVISLGILKKLPGPICAVLAVLALFVITNSFSFGMLFGYFRWILKKSGI